MNPKEFAELFSELAGSKKISSGLQIVYSGAGNPLDHAKLPELTNTIRNHAPHAEIGTFWNLHGVPSRAELIRRTRGLNSVALSVDAHHFAGLRNILGSANQVVKSIRERILWAKDAADANGFKLKIVLTGNRKEREFSRSIISGVAGKIALVDEEILPGGVLLGKKVGGKIRDGSIRYAILHNCTLTDTWPQKYD